MFKSGRRCGIDSSCGGGRQISIAVGSGRKWRSKGKAPVIFRRVDEKWGEHTIDRFACPDNVRVRSGVYNSRFLEPGMMNYIGIDTLAQSDWEMHNNYVHPPYLLIAPYCHIQQI